MASLLMGRALVSVDTKVVPDVWGYHRHRSNY